MDKKFKIIEIKKLNENDERAFESLISTNDVDAEDEVLLPSGANIKEFEQRQTVFYNHNHDLPIGKVVEIKKSSENIKAKIQLIKNPEGETGELYNLVSYIHNAIKQKIIRGMSVGYQVLESRNASRLDRTKFGKTVKRIISKWKLIELSVTPLPSNTATLITAVKSAVQNKKIDTKSAKIIYPDYVQEEEIKKSVEINLNPKKINKEKDIKEKVYIELQKKKGKFYY